MTIDEAEIERLRELREAFHTALVAEEIGDPRGYLNAVLRAQKVFAEAAYDALPALLEEREQDWHGEARRLQAWFADIFAALGINEEQTVEAALAEIARLQSELDAAREEIGRLQGMMAQVGRVANAALAPRAEKET